MEPAIPNHDGIEWTSMGRALQCQSNSTPGGLLLWGLKADSRRFAPFVAVLQASHPRKGYHPSPRRRLWCDYPGFGCIFVQAQMTKVLVIVGNEFPQHSVKLRSVQHDDLVQQLSA